MSTQTSGGQTEKQGNGGAFGAGTFGTAAATDNKQANADQHTEGKVAKMIEQQTAKLPSDTFLWGAIGAMGVSAILHFSGAKDQSRFIGQWVAPLLLFGVYNKLVKTQGHDQKS